jgi:hypothetical protein
MATERIEEHGITTPAYHRNAFLTPLLDLANEGSPGFNGKIQSESRVKWLGGDEANGPWIYWVERSAGELIKSHRHKGGRVEFIVRGAIDWYQGDEAVEWGRAGYPEGGGRRYETGSLTWVPAGTVYGYRIVEDTDVLLWFDGHPRGTEWAL